MKRITKNMCGIILGVTLCFAAIACEHDTDSISGNSETVITTSVTESTTSTSETTTTTSTTMEKTATTFTTNTTTIITTNSTTLKTNPQTEVEIVQLGLANIDIKEATQALPLSSNVENSETKTTEVVTTCETTTEISTTTMESTKKSVEEIAAEIWEGKWGTGADRKARLEAAGYNYAEVQAAVDAMISTPIINNGTVDNANSYPMIYVKNFSRGTYYAYGYQCIGGSGRSLIDCSQGSNEVNGSIASSYLYRNYGYNYNEKRTMVYLEISDYPSMNGYYYLDDSDAGNSNVIDFYYTCNSNCQFQHQGVVSVDCYIVSY